MRKVGIMGGTFDPIHIGHMLAATAAMEGANLDEVWFIPANTPPLKPNAPKASPEQRLKMVQLAISGRPHFHALDIELKRTGTSYSFDTVTTLLQLYKDVELYYIIGSDRVHDLSSWYKAEQLRDLIGFIGLNRAGEPLNMDSMSSEWKQKIHIVPMPLIEISSTMIRSRLARNQSIDYYCPEVVVSYIKEQRLYE